MRAIFLVDNGSLRPQATLNLRRVAASLSEQIGETVQAASLLQCRTRGNGDHCAAVLFRPQ